MANNLRKITGFHLPSSISVIYYKRKFQMEQASLTSRVFLKTGLGGHKGERIYACLHWKNYELFELSSES